MIVAANNMGNPHLMIINDNGHIVYGPAIRTRDYEIIQMEREIGSAMILPVNAGETERKYIVQAYDEFKKRLAALA